MSIPRGEYPWIGRVGVLEGRLVVLGQTGLAVGCHPARGGRSGRARRPRRPQTTPVLGRVGHDAIPPRPSWVSRVGSNGSPSRVQSVIRPSPLVSTTTVGHQPCAAWASPVSSRTRVLIQPMTSLTELRIERIVVVEAELEVVGVEAGVDRASTSVGRRVVVGHVPRREIDRIVLRERVVRSLAAPRRGWTVPGSGASSIRVPARPSSGCAGCPGCSQISSSPQ